MKNIIDEIEKIGIVPVIKIEELDDAVKIANALLEGGIQVAEITFRTDHAKGSIRLIKDNYPSMLIGAGTVISTQNVDDAIEAGADFIVSPGTNLDVIDYCQKKNILIIPGIATASELESVIALGINNVKFFPAEINGGLKAITALSGPYPNVRFMPTGGINIDNMCSYLESDKIIACGGSWMVSDLLVKNKRFDEVQKLTEEAVLKMLNLKLDNISISANDNDSMIWRTLGINPEQGNGKTLLKATTSSIVRLKHYLDHKSISYTQKENLMVEISSNSFIEISE